MKDVSIHLLSPLGSEKILWPYVLPKHDIIIEVKEPLGEARNAMDVCLNGRRTVCG